MQRSTRHSLALFAAHSHLARQTLFLLCAERRGAMERLLSQLPRMRAASQEIADEFDAATRQVCALLGEGSSAHVDVAVHEALDRLCVLADLGVAIRDSVRIEQ